MRVQVPPEAYLNLPLKNFLIYPSINNPIKLIQKTPKIIEFYVFQRGPFYTFPKSIVHKMLEYVNKHNIMAFTTVSIAKALRIKPAQLSDRLHRLVKKNAFYRSPSMVGFFSNNGEYIYSLERQYIFDYYFQLLRRLAPDVAKAYDYITKIGEPMSSIDILQEFSQPSDQSFFGSFLFGFE